MSGCRTRGESEDHTSEKVRKKDPPWLSIPGQTSQKQGYQWAYQKYIYVLQKLKKKDLHYAWVTLHVSVDHSQQETHPCLKRVLPDCTMFTTSSDDLTISHCPFSWIAWGGYVTVVYVSFSEENKPHISISCCATNRKTSDSAHFSR